MRVPDSIKRDGDELKKNIVARFEAIKKHAENAGCTLAAYSTGELFDYRPSAGRL